MSVSGVSVIVIAPIRPRACLQAKSRHNLSGNGAKLEFRDAQHNNQDRR